MDAKRRAVATYEAAADHYDDAALSFWDRFGRRTIERIRLSRGASVLDVCCGAGASALPAAEAVGESGRVLAIDLARRPLDLGRKKAAERGLPNVEFRCADVEEIDARAGVFDAVVCVFGIFFLSDQAGCVRRLSRLLRPGGVLAITTWGSRLFEPATTAFWKAVREHRPELYKSFNPWDALDTTGKLRELFLAGGLREPECEAESGRHRIRTPADWWTIALGSGYRGTIDQLTPEAAESVSARCVEFLRVNEITELEANAVYGCARRSEDRPRLPPRRAR